MEKAANSSSLPRPSGIPRLPRPIASNTIAKPQSSQLPVNYSLTVPRSRLRAVQAKNQVFPSRANHELERAGPVLPQEAENKTPPLEDVDPVSIQPPPPQALPLHPSGGRFDSTDQGRKEEHGGNMVSEKSEPEAEIPDKKPSVVPRRPRMSLSDRTIETLSQIPPSPSPRRRKSNFFPDERPTSSLSRPASSLGQARLGSNGFQYPDCSTPRRPSPTKLHNKALNVSQSVKSTSGRRSVSSFAPRSVPHPQIRPRETIDTTPSKLPPVPKLSNDSIAKWSNHHQVETLNKIGERVNSRNPNSAVGNSQPPRNGTIHDHTSKQLFKNKTYAPKSTKQRAPITNLFPRPPQRSADDPKNRVGSTAKKISPTLPASPTPASSVLSSTPAVQSRTLGAYNGPAPSFSRTSTLDDSPKSSAALRETIAKAKAARRAKVKDQGSQSLLGHPTVRPNAADEQSVLFGGAAEVQKILQKRIDTARTTGKLNISALSLSEFPREVNEMYNLERIDSDHGEWYESVDLVRLIAADNEFESLDDWVFPDVSTQAASDMDDDFCGNTFRGLESLDLHGNRLFRLPEGLRHLDRLKTVNLSKNRVTNGILNVLSQVHSLRELRLSENLLDGDPTGFLSNLKSLEVLDLRDNAISDISVGLADLVNLRVLIVAGNKLTSIPFLCLQSLPLVELDAARNRLDGILIPQSVDGLSTLKTLDVSSNALTGLLENEATSLSSLQVLNIAENRLCAIPDVSKWAELVTLSAGGNKLLTIPEGLTNLEKVRNIDLTRNNLKALDYNIGLMDSLTTLRIANNPLRERRHLTMTTEDLKIELRNRLLPDEPSEPINHEGPIPDVPTSSTASTKWSITPSGILDRSSTSLQNLNATDLEPILETNNIKSLLLHHNALTHIPPAIAFTQATLTTLDLGHNRLSTSSSYLPNALALPHLTTLSLASNALSSLLPLLNSLSAPLLSTLEISHNRLTSLPPLRHAFPALTTVLASENVIEDLEIEAVRGLRVLDVTGNEISHLRPELGLLGSSTSEVEEGGGALRELRVGGNRFRVPRREVLERGSAAVLAWLRGKVVGRVEGEG